MPFVENLSSLQQQVQKYKHQIKNKEAAKLALAIPFIEALGFDVRDPYEVIPGFSLTDKCQDAGSIDFCMMVNGTPAFLLACQAPGETLDIQQSGLPSCYPAIPCKFAILTNGIQYQFFSDLEKDHQLDPFPFLDIDLEELSDADLVHLDRFHKQVFNPKEILVAVTAIKFRRDLKEALYQELVNPSEEFIFHILKSIKIGRVTQKLIEAYRPDGKECIREALEELVDDMISPSSSSPLLPNEPPAFDGELLEARLDINEPGVEEGISEEPAQIEAEHAADEATLEEPAIPPVEEDPSADGRVEVFLPADEAKSSNGHPTENGEHSFSIRY